MGNKSNDYLVAFTTIVAEPSVGRTYIDFNVLTENAKVFKQEVILA